MDSDKKVYLKTKYNNIHLTSFESIKTKMIFTYSSKN